MDAVPHFVPSYDLIFVPTPSIQSSTSSNTSEFSHFVNSPSNSEEQSNSNKLVDSIVDFFYSSLVNNFDIPTDSIPPKRSDKIKRPLKYLEAYDVDIPTSSNSITSYPIT